jgi:hypothetical protein
MSVSFATDIAPLFRNKDVSCMKGFGVALNDYEYMSDAAGDDTYADHAHARAVFCHLQIDGCTPRMPLGGPYWSDEQLALFEQWMADGFVP